MVIEFGSDSGTILAVFLGLVLFGVVYNAFVEWLEGRGYTEGYLALIVAVGVFVTIVGIAVINFQAAIIALVAFAGSGLPMIIGSIVRYLRNREAEKKAMIREIKGV